MCFSASASFATGAVLGTAGGTTFKKARRHEKLVALIPIFFAIQQTCEGFVWLTIHHGEPSLVASYSFLFFAHIFWSIYIPIAMYVLEKQTRKIMYWFIVAGIVTSLTALFGLLTYPLNIQVIGHSISYGAKFPFQTPLSYLYLLVVFGALFVNPKPFFRWAAVILLILAGITQAFFYLTFASVWCFFAAVSSVMVAIYLHRKYPVS
jgi:hypothetical protein